ncbi:nitroreductase family protein [Peribacillus butanolivorans]|uniref:nitroreductase family protein n=1 Tax=Peribacillus butanolivorans TaxID=421767 RepID=UPI00365A3F5F
MSLPTDQNLSTIIKERHSIRKYDPTYKISKKEIENILDEATQAPSSSNLQAWRFIVIEDQNIKKELRQIANNQESVETSSAVIAVLGDTEMYKNVDKIYGMNVEAGFMDQATRERMVSNTMNTYPHAPKETRESIANFDAGLVSMQLMLIAKSKGYDTVTMGGFNKQQFIEKFDVPERYVPIVLIAIGKSAGPSFQTTRLPLNEVAKFI